MAYSKTNWVNDSSPAISAENLNKIENELENLDNGLGDVYTKEEIGDLEDLTTTDKTSVVNAVNEINEPSNWVKVGDTIPTDGRKVLFKGGKNLFDKDNVQTLSAYINSSNQIIGNSSAVSIYVPCEPNTTYTMSKISGKAFSLAYSNELPQINGTTIGRIINATGTNITITTGNEAKYLVSQIRESSDTLTLQQILDSIQIELGSTATTYEAYVPQDLIVNGGKFMADQLVSVGATNSNDGRRIWFSKNERNLFNYNTIVSGDITGADPTIRLSSRQPLYLSNGTYTFSTNQPSPFRYSIQVQNVGVPPLSSYPTYILNSGWQTSSSYTFTISNPGYVVVNISKNNNATLTPSEISSYHYQLEQGSTATNYEAYVDKGIYVDNEQMHFDNYSTNEQVIGKWIDGKNIYRKTYKVTNISSSNVDLVDVSGLNFDTIIKLYGFVRSQVGMCMPMPLTDSASNYNVLFLSVNKIRGRVVFGTGGSLKDCYVTIEYTKN